MKPRGEDKKDDIVRKNTPEIGEKPSPISPFFTDFLCMKRPCGV
jgi:hypothetical protein